MALGHGENLPRIEDSAAIRRVAAIINPVSGAGLDRSAATHRVTLVRDTRTRAGLSPSIHVTERSGHARELAAVAVREDDDLLIVCGGGGTVNEAGYAFLHTRTALDLSPAGPANGLAASLGVPRDPAAALQRVLAI